jgi:hypothetical protein
MDDQKSAVDRVEGHEWGERSFNGHIGTPYLRLALCLSRALLRAAKLTEIHSWTQALHAIATVSTRFPCFLLFWPYVGLGIRLIWLGANSIPGRSNAMAPITERAAGKAPCHLSGVLTREGCRAVVFRVESCKSKRAVNSLCNLLLIQNP